MDINNLEKETGLRFRKDYMGNNIYREISGKSFNVIQQKINEYNIRHNTRIYVYNDDLKDSTYIEVRGNRIIKRICNK